MNSPVAVVPKARKHGASPAPVVGMARQKFPEILQEQFEYLLRHSATCRSRCSDCARFGRIAAILMEPFRSDRFA